MEAEMRVILAAFVGVFALAAIPVEAAPVVGKAGPVELGAAPPIELVAGGCGPGWHHRHWRDQWGNWHWGRCIPN
jgi:hypothetical protein